MKKLSFGIDLGTTNSCIAVMVGGKNAVPETIKMEDGSKTLPSCVMFDHGKVIVGKEAYRHRFDVNRVIYSSKTHIGSNHTYKINDGDRKFVVTPVDAAAHILRTLKERAELYYGKDNVIDVVITVPSYFNITKRKATAEAAKQAGLNVIGIINEPSAAALAYSLDKKDNEPLLVYDLGGGTFDVTAMKILSEDVGDLDFFEDAIESDKTAQVLATAGNDRLGGDDYDREVLRLALKRGEQAYREKNPKSSPIRLDKLLSRGQIEELLLDIEQCKKDVKALAHVITVTVKIDGKSVQIPIAFGADEYEAGMKPIFRQTLEKVNECLNATKIRDQIKRIVYVGGSTKSAYLRKMLEDEFKGLDFYYGLNPDESVALGAAMYAASLTGQLALTVNDVLPISIGIDCDEDYSNYLLKGRFKKLLSNNTRLPAEATYVFYTAEEQQTEATIDVYQGSSNICQNNVYLGSVVLRNLPAKRAHDVGIKVNLRVDINGLLTVTAQTGDVVEAVTLENVLVPKSQTNTKDKLLGVYRNIVSNANLSEEDRAVYYKLIDDCAAGITEMKAVVSKVSQLGKERFERIDNSLHEGYDETMVGLTYSSEQEEI